MNQKGHSYCSQLTEYSTMRSMILNSLKYMVQAVQTVVLLSAFYLTSFCVCVCMCVCVCVHLNVYSAVVWNVL